MANRAEAIEALFACAKLGAIAVPINPLVQGEFLRHQLSDSGASYLICDAAGLVAAASVVSGTALRAAVVVGTADELAGESERSVLLHAGEVGLSVQEYASLISSTHQVPDLVGSGRDVFAILYTSGTTGDSKGCMISHDYALVSPQAAIDAGWLQPDDVQFTAFALSHQGGLTIVLGALLCGAPAVVQPVLSASTFVDEAAAEGATVIRTVGAVAVSMLAQPPREDDDKHNFRLACFFPMSVEDQKAFEERFATPVVTEIYGQTECAPLTLNPLGSPRRTGSVGPAASHLEVRVVDEDDNEVATGQLGEIVARPKRGPIFSGYWGRPEETLVSARNYWHHTGDYGRMDEEGFVYFVDRKQDSIRRRGEIIASLDLEVAVRVHPKIQSVAMCSVPASSGDSDIRAFLILEEGETFEAAELFKFFAEVLPQFAIPRYVTICEEFPRTPNGRPRKQVLREAPIDDDTWDFAALGL